MTKPITKESTSMHKYMDIFKEAISGAQSELTSKEFYTLYKLNHIAMSTIAALLDLADNVKEDIDSTVEAHAEAVAIDTVKEHLESTEKEESVKAEISGVSTDAMDSVLGPIKEILESAAERLKAPEFYIVLKILRHSIEIHVDNLDMPADFEKAINSMVSRSSKHSTVKSLKDLGIKLPPGITGGAIMSEDSLEDIPKDVMEEIETVLDEMTAHIMEGSDKCDTCPKQKHCEKLREGMSNKKSKSSGTDSIIKFPTLDDVDGDPNLN